jgi:nucleotide-binding universal stress UspA family protein
MPGELEVGATLDGFRIEEQVHSGGMAVLYRVSNPDAGFPLLMKVPRLGHGEPASSLISFEVEQMVLEALQGPHVPRFVAKGDLTHVPYIVMERVAGRSLHDWTARAPLAAEEVARLGAALATALHSVHLQDAIHLDLKPSNVMIRPDGGAVLVDFGLAHHGFFPDLLAEEYRRPIGSAPYISPEQVAGGRSDPRSDLFSLGVVLYELATGQLPFGSPSSEGGIRARLWRSPVPPRAVVPDVPEWLQEVILHCLEVDAGQRYPSASQVAFDLSHPEQVAIGDRGRRLRVPGGLTTLRHWIRATGYEPPEVPRPSATVSRASIVLAAVATTHTDEPQADAIREAVRRIMAAGGHTRLAVVSVVRPTSELGGSTPEETASRQRIRHLVVLRHWAEPLQLTAGQVSFHVVESTEPAEALLAYARANQVDHVVIGAPPRDVALRGMLGAVSSRVAPEAAPEPLSFFRLLGSVATKVAAEAPCTVTIVRPRTVG